ncbi:MAG: SDR family oxidoreductase [Acidimicrobiales bacterium]
MSTSWSPPTRRSRDASSSSRATSRSTTSASTTRRLAADITEVWHLAAVYDLAVPREVGMRINVVGTEHVLRFAESAPGLTRHQYVSTCYVSGRYAGPFAESDLDVGQRFNNFYEETKFLAEVAVAERMRGACPRRSTARRSWWGLDDRPDPEVRRPVLRHPVAAAPEAAPDGHAGDR